MQLYVKFQKLATLKAVGYVPKTAISMTTLCDDNEKICVREWAL